LPVNPGVCNIQLSTPKPFIMEKTTNSSFSGILRKITLFFVELLSVLNIRQAIKVIRLFLEEFFAKLKHLFGPERQAPAV
jgi:hypothetical protein